MQAALRNEGQEQLGHEKATFLSPARALRWSTSVLVCFTWLSYHVIYLKMRQKESLLQAELTYYFHSKWSDLILSENSFLCEFAQLLKQFILSQLEKNSQMNPTSTDKLPNLFLLH